MGCSAAAGASALLPDSFDCYRYNISVLYLTHLYKATKAVQEVNFKSPCCCGRCRGDTQSIPVGCANP